jgi:trigger factor
MSNAGVAERPNKVEISDAGPSRKKISIEIPADTVNESLGSSMDTLMVEAELPGFRKGRVPRRLVEKKFGVAVKKQAKEQLIASAFSRAIEDNKIRVLGNPTSPDLDKIEVEQGKPLKFELEVEVLPEFSLPELDGMVVKKPKFTVGDDLVDSEYGKLKVQEGRLEDRESPEPGDYLTGHAKLVGPGDKVLFESDGIVVQVPPVEKKGQGMIVGLVVEDLAKQLGTPKRGETKTIKTKGPESHENEAIRGADLTVTYTPERIDRIIPATAEDLMARFGFGSEDQIKSSLRQRLEQRVQIEQQQAMRGQVAAFLLNSVKMDLPERITAGQAGRNLERARLELMYRGVDPMKIEENLAALRARSANDAVRDLKLFFILDRAAEQLKVTVTEAEVNGRVAMMAMERNQRPEQLRQELIRTNQIQGVYQQLREHKTMDAIIARAKVEEVSPEEFAKGN